MDATKISKWTSKLTCHEMPDTPAEYCKLLWAQPILVQWLVSVMLLSPQTSLQPRLLFSCFQRQKFPLSYHPQSQMHLPESMVWPAVFKPKTSSNVRLQKSTQKDRAKKFYSKWRRRNRWENLKSILYTHKTKLNESGFPEWVSGSRPQISSRRTTPKLYTSLFSVNCWVE